MAISYIKNTNKRAARHMDYVSLRKCTLETTVPFQVSLDNSTENVICNQIIRVIPKSRMVAFGQWHGQPVVIKFLYKPLIAAFQFKKEIQGLEILHIANIPTPKILWQGRTKDKKSYVIILEQITDATSLDSVWMNPSLDAKEKIQILYKVILEIAILHVFGIIQRDLHLKNFLLGQDSTLYLLDGGQVQYYQIVVPKRISLDNLALFFSQLGIIEEQIQEKLLQRYLKARGWKLKQADRKFLLTKTKTYIARRRFIYSKKIYRSSTEFIQIQNWRSLMICKRNIYTVQFIALLKNLDDALASKEAIMLKNGRSSTVVRLKIDDKHIVVKRYNIKNFMHGLMRCWRNTRASLSWKYALELHFFRVPTAQAYAMYEKRFLWWRGVSYFIMEYIEGPNIDIYFNLSSQDFYKIELVCEKIFSMFLILTKMRLVHHDLKSSNILVNEGRAILIDLDSVTEYFFLRNLTANFYKSMQRFMRNWEQSPKLLDFFNKKYLEFAQNYNLL